MAPPESMGGHEARLRGLEHGQSEIFRRLRVVDRLDVKVDGVQEDVRNCATNCEAIRAYVDREISKQQAEEAEERRLSSGEKIAIIGGVALVLAGLISALASLAAAGVL